MSQNKPLTRIKKHLRRIPLIASLVKMKEAIIKRTLLCQRYENTKLCKKEDSLKPKAILDLTEE